jgi:hypothetical protein
LLNCLFAEGALDDAVDAQSTAQNQLGNVLTDLGGRADEFEPLDMSALSALSGPTDYSAELFASSDVPEWEW